MAVRFSASRWLVAGSVVAALGAPQAAFAQTAAGTPITLTTETGDADILSAPSTDIGVKLLYIVVTANSPVQVTCWIRGGAIDGDTIWYRAVSPAKGYIAGAQLNVPAEPFHGVPTCKKPPATTGTTAGGTTAGGAATGGAATGGAATGGAATGGAATGGAATGGAATGGATVGTQSTGGHPATSSGYGHHSARPTGTHKPKHPHLCHCAN